MSHADNIHLGASAIGGSLISCIMAAQRDRQIANENAEAEANSVASVRALRNELAASVRREAALQERLNRANFELLRTQAALRRIRPQG
jgi:hypothetical protein